ncbi:MAG TPA: HRDC domain-containing protein, partial [Acidobacteriota bacterium]
LGRLRRLRWRLALRLGVEPYRLFSNRTLLELVQRRPRSAVDLIQVPGFGPWRLERIGRQVLDAVADESALVDRTERTSGNQADADPPPG